jgi:hypothetical protein
MRMPQRPASRSHALNKRLTDADRRERAVIVAVLAVRVVKMTVDQVVDVIAMRHGRVTAGGGVNVRGVMRAARVPGRARIWVGAIDLDLALVGVAIVDVVKVAIVDVVDVAVVTNGHMATARAMNVSVVGVNVVIHGQPGLQVQHRTRDRSVPS